VSKTLFTFTPPQGVERIPFLARVRQGPAQPAGAEASPPAEGAPQATGSTGGEPK
jgi:hypothetical protein